MVKYAEIIALLVCGPQRYAVINMEERHTRITAEATGSKNTLRGRKEKERFFFCSLSSGNNIALFVRRTKNWHGSPSSSIITPPPTTSRPQVFWTFLCQRKMLRFSGKLECFSWKTGVKNQHLFLGSSEKDSSSVYWPEPKGARMNYPPWRTRQQICKIMSTVNTASMAVKVNILQHLSQFSELFSSTNLV